MKVMTYSAARTTLAETVGEETEMSELSRETSDQPNECFVGVGGLDRVRRRDVDVLGSFHAIQGLVAILNDDQYLVGSGDLVVHVDYTAWGWTHLIAGAVAIFAGFGLFKGQTWARVVGVIFAVLSAIVNVGFLPAYPIWSVMMIALDIIIIMALTVHGF